MEALSRWYSRQPRCKCFCMDANCCDLQAVELARALRNLPDEVRAFKGIAAFQEHAYAYLDRAAAAPACCHA